jgi:transposase-like protein
MSIGRRFMINWELPREQPACPHCGSTDTQMTLQLLGLTRYSCPRCRKSFAAERDGRTSTRTETEPAADPTPRQA